MAGVYFHVPFCHSKCLYCDFYSRACSPKQSEERQTRYVQNIMQEISERASEAGEERIDTLYFGGGTPSALSVESIRLIVNKLRKVFGDRFMPSELTIEVNPEDVCAENVEQWRDIGFNRVSMGCQSFVDEELRAIGRRHTSEEALEAFRTLRNGGFDNISLDLMFALPLQNISSWSRSLDKILALQSEHISAYGLTIEEGTPLQKLISAGKITVPGESEYVEMFSLLCDRLRDAGYDHYEVSNFALPGKHSRHNSSYWEGVPYLGIGPSASSYDGIRTRRTNSPSEEWMSDEPFVENLSDDQLLMEYVMTRLRTSKGLDLQHIAGRFGEDARTRMAMRAEKFVDEGKLCREEEMLKVSRDGVMVLDNIICELI